MKSNSPNLLVRNILSVYYSASLADVIQGKFWYRNAEEIALNLSKRYQISFIQAAAVIAAVSPQNEWSNNVRLAERLIVRVKLSGETAASGGGYLGLGLRKVDLILDENLWEDVNALLAILNGDKTKAFFSNIIGDHQQVCVDGHAQNIAYNGLLRKSITKAKSIKTKEYLSVQSAYQDAASIIGEGISPAMCQAVTWVAYKNIDFIRSK